MFLRYKTMKSLLLEPIDDCTNKRRKMHLMVVPPHPSNRTRWPCILDSSRSLFSYFRADREIEKENATHSVFIARVGSLGSSSYEGCFPHPFGRSCSSLASRWFEGIAFLLNEGTSVLLLLLLLHSFPTSPRSLLFRKEPFWNEFSHLILSNKYFYLFILDLSV